jgi:hypothetical protein
VIDCNSIQRMQIKSNVVLEYPNDCNNSLNMIHSIHTHSDDQGCALIGGGGGYARSETVPLDDSTPTPGRNFSIFGMDDIDSEKHRWILTSKRLYGVDKDKFCPSGYYTRREIEEKYPTWNCIERTDEE